MLTPLADRVVLKRLQASEKTASGIVLPETAKEKPEQGEIIAVGKEVKELKKGNKVVFGKYSATEVKEGGEEFLILKEEDVLAVIA